MSRGQYITYISAYNADVGQAVAITCLFWEFLAFLLVQEGNYTKFSKYEIDN